MQQPLSSTALPPPRSPSPPPLPSPPKGDNKKRRKKKLPTAEEVLSHYESQGLDSREASLKAIGELQSLLYKSFTSSSSLARKLDNVNTRLAIVESKLESKLDSKPDFPQSFAIAFSSGALLHAFSSIWDSVKSATRGSPPPL